MSNSAAKWRFMVLFLLFAMILAMVTGCGRFISRQMNTSDREPETVTDVLTYNIQVGLFDTQDEAETVAEDVRSSSILPVTVVYKAPFYRVWIIAHVPADEVDELIDRLHSNGYTEARRIYEEQEY